LLRGFKTEPGTQFEYQSGATQLLGFALRKGLNQKIADYASEKLWQPLGMEANAQWNTDDFGMEKTFCCINATSRDFAKLGQLFLNEGSFNGKEVIKSTLVKEMRTPTKLSNGAYGMGLWINNDSKIKHYYFRGLYGQYIIIVPEKNMVIVRTGMNKNENLDAKGRPKEVEKYVVEAVKIFG
jgi:CubicO group peptidase (beta-lactamase class C family)